MSTDGHHINISFLFLFPHNNTSLLAGFWMMNKINVLYHVHDYGWFHVFLLW